MPFKSEAQRRYLWANEPEIARDWTDTYGSKIHAADGGIMRLGFYRGGSHHAGSTTDIGGTTGNTGNGADARFKNYAVNPDFSTINAPPSYENRNQRITHTPRTKGFFGKVGTGIKDYIMGGGAIGMGIRGLTNIFGTKPTGWESTMGPRQDMGYNPNRVNPFSAPDRGGDGPYIPPQYNWDDLYAQNIVGDEELDIDTSTGNMEDWSQRFRVDDPYRQDQGALDEQIREYISTLYT